MIDEGFPLLKLLGDEIEQLEEELLDTPNKHSLSELHHLKRTLLIVRRMLWPQREVLNSLARDDTGIILEENQVYYRDCYNHTIQIMDLIETYRDMATGLMDVYLSSVSYRLNEVMRVLTIIATIFIPLTFIICVYGMNFTNNETPGLCRNCTGIMVADDCYCRRYADLLQAQKMVLSLELKMTWQTK